jgi:hypothetical protein
MFHEEKRDFFCMIILMRKVTSPLRTVTNSTIIEPKSH